MGKISKSIRAETNSYHDIVHWVRGCIYGGQFAPGDKLPPQTKLTKQFGVSNQTVQRAIVQLNRQGLVISCQKTGSIISDEAPTLSTVGLALPETVPPQQNENIFWNRLVAEAKSIKAGGFRIRPYFGLEYGHPVSDIKKMIKDIKGHELAGVIFTAHIDQLENTPVMSHPGIPRIHSLSSTFLQSKMDDYNKRKDGFVLTPECELIEKMLSWTARSGRRRVAVLTITNNYECISQMVERLAAVYGLTIKPHWILGMELERGMLATRRLINLIFSPEMVNGPEALLVLDDNMLNLAAQGIMDAGLSVPDDVLLLSHSNFPNPVKCPLPVKRFGMDVRTLLEKSVEMVGLYWKNGSMPSPMRIPCVTEE
ncbi:MAG: GntR family transcriptional regulator [Victivallales bacterium]